MANSAAAIRCLGEPRGGEAKLLAARVLLAVAQVCLLAYSAYWHSPGVDEVGHLPAGISYWQLGAFDLYRVNPPLTRLVAALPSVATGAELDWSPYRSGLTDRPEWRMGRAFIAAHPDNWHLFFVAGRWALIPLMFVGGHVCFSWARQLYGDRAGLFALCLWTFSPNLLGWGATITPDASAAVTGILAGYCFWKWLTEPLWCRAVAAGLALGLAELTKMTWVVLFPLWPVLWLIWSSRKGTDATRCDRARQFGQLAAILLLAFYLLNLGYAFEGSFQPLGEYTFFSRTLAGSGAGTTGGGGNRFAGTFLAKIPIPVPKNYLSGMDQQKLELENGMWSYLMGEWRHGGWWYYYIVCAALKVPLGTWVLGLLALGMTIWGLPAYRADWRHELALLAPAVVVFVFVSSQTGFNHHFRYLLPCLPFVFVWTSKIGKAFELKRRSVAILAGLALVWSVTSSLLVYPHSLSYFNELAGGARYGHHYLIDSNVDWGQDLWYLKQWYDAHPEVGSLRAEVNGVVELKSFGIQAERPPVGPTEDLDLSSLDPAEFRMLGPLPGWYAVSSHRLHDRSGRYDYLLKYFTPVETVGRSIHIYHITPEEANHVRAELNLPSD